MPPQRSAPPASTGASTGRASTGIFSRRLRPHHFRFNGSLHTGFVFVGCYLLAVLAPLLLRLLASGRRHESVLHLLGSSMGVVGFSPILMHFVLTARLKWVEKPFGMDLLYVFHRATALLSFMLVIGHVALLAAERRHWFLLFGLHVHGYTWIGRLALAALIAQILSAVFRAKLRLNYRRWKRLHGSLALAVLLGGFVHAWLAGIDAQPMLMRGLWSLLLGAALAAYGWYHWGRPAQMRRRPYRIMEVRREAADVWTISLSPGPKSAPVRFLPGQYQYLTLFRNGVKMGEHPLTFSSSPASTGVVSATVKASGRLASVISEPRPGDPGWVDAPYGRFSYLLHPKKDSLVFIAGGIGITPLISMLRHLSDTPAAGDTQAASAHGPQSVLLLYANRTEEGIVFRAELDALERKSAEPGSPCRLRVVHLLSSPSAEWTGETGRLDAEKLGRLCGETGSHSYYICGPSGFIDATASSLRGLGVPRRCIHFERFSF